MFSSVIRIVPSTSRICKKTFCFLLEEKKMNFDLPSPKEKYSIYQTSNPFPVGNISENGEQYKAYFNGLSVEVIDEETIKVLYGNGCFGIGTQTKTRPKCLVNERRIQTITQNQYKQKLEWQSKFGNKNPNKVMVKLLAPLSDITAEPTEVDDPFPFEEFLALLLEEAFFLHYSLKCLTIFNFNATKEFNTHELINLFCDNDPRFIERYVAYQYYRAKNWVVKSGLKFGGDFLLYHKGPEFTHASYVVLVSDNEVNQNHLDVQSNYRVSDTTGKTIIILKVTRPNGLDYSQRFECFTRLNEFQVTEIIPKRFLYKQLAVAQKSNKMNSSNKIEK